MKISFKTMALVLAGSALLTTSVSAHATKHHRKHHHKHKHRAVECPPAPCAQAPCDCIAIGTGLYVGGVAGQQKIASRASVDTFYGDSGRNVSTEDGSSVFVPGRSSNALFGLNDRTFIGGALVGYGLEWLRMYWGLEGEMLFGSTKSKAHLNISTDGTSDTRVYAKTGYAWGAALRFGKQLGCTLLYARFGMDGRRFRIGVDTNSGDLNLENKLINAKRSRVGLVPGVGFEVNIVNGLSVRFEARESFYKGFSKRSPSIAPNGGTHMKLKTISNSALLVGLTYKTGLLELKPRCAK